MQKAINLITERIKRNILEVDYFNGVDVLFKDDESKELFLKEAYIIKTHANGKRSRKIQVKKILQHFTNEAPRAITIRYPVTERNVISLEAVDRKGNTILNWPSKVKK